MDRNEKWRQWYENELRQPYVQKIIEKAEQLDNTVLLSPDRELWFKSLEFADFTKIHTVIVASHPHRHTYAADGYAFSCIDEADREMELLYKKLYNELGVVYDQYDNSKERWVKQGILLLPMELTTQNGKLNDTSVLWSPFIGKVLRYFLSDKQRRAFLFLDRYSSKMPELFYDRQESENLILKHDFWEENFQKIPIFTIINKFLWDNYRIEIDWS